MRFEIEAPDIALIYCYLQRYFHTTMQTDMDFTTVTIPTAISAALSVHFQEELFPH